ncbi:restriction endonuclease subunit S [Shewanella frigidimarina]|uniref:restriction endonuclease subunit S n=1 Tax=Shewanella frigidimarina TaxID=56812 RepID=UPI0031775DF2
MSWPLVKLGSLDGGKGNFVDGPFGSNLKSSEYTESGVPLIQLKNIKPNKYITKNLKFVSQEKADSINRHSYKAGDVCIAKLGAVGTACIIPEGAPDGIIVADVVRFRGDKTLIDYKYLCHYLNSSIGQRAILKLSRGSTRTRTNLTDLKTVEIPLPPLAEQKRIAAILDKADAIRRKRKQAIKLADDFLRSVFLDMFGDPVANPKGWEVKPLKTGINEIKAGWSAKGESNPCKSGEIGVLKISSVTSKIFKPSENKFVAQSLIKGKTLVFPEKGDLLFSRANTRELVAATCIITESRSDVFLPDKLWKIKTESELLLPEFLHFLIQHPKFKDALTSQATGTSGSMLNISKAKFENSLGIFPPIEMQNKFKYLFWKVTSLNGCLSKSTDGIEDNFNSLSQKAFAGEL